MPNIMTREITLLSTSIFLEIITMTKESSKVTIGIHLDHIAQTIFILKDKIVDFINSKSK
jgi:hypothetical protein